MTIEGTAIKGTFILSPLRPREHRGIWYQKNIRAEGGARVWYGMLTSGHGIAVYS